LEFRSESIEVKSSILEPQITEQPYYSAAIFIKESLDKINSAGNKLDIEEILPTVFAKNMLQDVDFWWSIKVKYEIYGCDENNIDVKLEYYNRSDTFFDEKTRDSLTRFSLNKIRENWIINKGIEITGTTCNKVFP